MINHFVSVFGLHLMPNVNVCPIANTVVNKENTEWTRKHVWTPSLWSI